MVNTDTQISEKCRAKLLADNLVDCLTPDPRFCFYAMSFGNGYFCRHPMKMEIVRRTQELEKSRINIHK